MKNKPQWLIDAEKAQSEFNESKFGKMSQKSINISNRNYLNNVNRTDYDTINRCAKIFKNASPRYNPKYQSSAGKKGGKITKDSGKLKKSSVVGGNITKSKFEKLRKQMALKVYNIIELNKWYTKKEILKLLINDKTDLKYANKCIRQLVLKHDEFKMFQKDFKGKGKTSLYKKREDY